MTVTFHRSVIAILLLLTLSACRLVSDEAMIETLEPDSMTVPESGAALATEDAEQTVLNPTRTPVESEITDDTAGAANVADTVVEAESRTVQNTVSNVNTVNNAILPCTNDLTFVADVTIPDGTTIDVSQTFTKTWRVRNSGTCTWGEGYTFRKLSSSGIDRVSNAGHIRVPPTAPGQTIDLSAYMTVFPEQIERLETGIARFQMFDPQGNAFGQVPFVEVTINYPELPANPVVEAVPDNPVVPVQPVQSAGVCQDVRFESIPMPVTLAPGDRTSLTWRIKNNGTCIWQGYVLGWAPGSFLLIDDNTVALPTVSPGQTITVQTPVVLVETAPQGNVLDGRFQVVDNAGNPIGGVGIVSVHTTQADGGTCQNEAAVESIPGLATIQHGAHVRQSETISKTFRLRNTGSCTWSGYTLRQMNAAAMPAMLTWTDGSGQVAIPVTAPGEAADVTVTMNVPADAPSGRHIQDYFTIRTESGGMAFGPPDLFIYVIVD